MPTWSQCVGLVTLFALTMLATETTCLCLHSRRHNWPTNQLQQIMPAFFNFELFRRESCEEKVGVEEKSSRTSVRTEVFIKIGKRVLAGCAVLGLFSRPAFAVASAYTTGRLGLPNIAAAATMLVALAVLPLFSSGVPSIATALLVSASRCAIQVFLLGSVVLQRVMGVRQPLVVAFWIFGVGLIAGREAFSRIQYTYPKMRRHVYASVLSGGFSVLFLTLALNVLGPIEPWFQPRAWIPVAGMLFGNTLSASALAASSITKNFAILHEQVELRLARGATWREAIRPLVQDTLSTALTPTINGLAVTGIVHIPGMMTGQILAGQSPPQAAAYQIMINFLIASTACATAQLLVRSVIGTLVDTKNHRLRLGRLAMKKRSRSQQTRVLESSKRVVVSTAKTIISERDEGPNSNLTAVDLNTSTDALRSLSATSPILEAIALEVPRAKARVSFSLRPGDRIGLVGRSGSGKSQILRAIAGLEGDNLGSLQLHSRPLDKIPLPEYRTRVLIVPQNRPTLEGTPMEFYSEILRLEYQKLSRCQAPGRSPIGIATRWGLEESIFDQPWSTLSGGEAQRVSLAIALALQPDVLLLDEVTSALDDTTSKIVETTLIECNMPIVIVTHSSEQLLRFCTRTIELPAVDGASSVRVHVGE